MLLLFQNIWWVISYLQGSWQSKTKYWGRLGRVTSGPITITCEYVFEKIAIKILKKTIYVIAMGPQTVLWCMHCMFCRGHLQFLRRQCFSSLMIPTLVFSGGVSAVGLQSWWDVLLGLNWRTHILGVTETLVHSDILDWRLQLVFVLNQRSVFYLTSLLVIKSARVKLVVFMTEATSWLANLSSYCIFNKQKLHENHSA